MKTQAQAKFIGTSSRKLNLVAGLIRGKSATEAAKILDLTGKRASTPLTKVLQSAVANAVTNHGAKKTELLVESVFVGPGPTLKRFRPRARGGAGSIRKRTSHITVILTDKQSADSQEQAAKTKAANATSDQLPANGKEAK